MKKILCSSIIASFLSFSVANDNTTFVADELTGDTKLSCEAILCLSSGTRPNECAPSISRYFSISFDDWSDTISARRNFLNLCPTGNIQDHSLNTLKNEVLVNMKTDCTAKYLNSKQETIQKAITRTDATKCGTNDRGKALTCTYEETHYRVSTRIPNYCKALMQHEYTDKKFKYTCNKEYLPLDKFKASNQNCWVE